MRRPADPDRLLEDPGVLAWNRQDDYMPYWAYLWPGAYLLAQALGARARAPEGGRALEIGCGLGLAGLVALERGWHVTFSDYDPAPLEFVRQSAEASGFEPVAVCHRSARLARPSRPTITDRSWGPTCFTNGRLVPLVANLLATLLAPDGLALIAGPYRVATEGLARELDRHGLRHAAEPIVAWSEEQGTVRGTLYRINRTHVL